MTAPTSAPADFYGLRLKALWQAFRAEGLAFWLLCTYMMFEYVRPQSAYPALAVLPWSTGTMLATGLVALAGRRLVRVSSPANILLAFFSFVWLLSSIAAYRPADSYAEAKGYYLWILAYLLITRIVVNQRRMLMLMLAFTLFNIKMALFATRSWMSIGFVFRDWGVGGAPGFFQNSGEFGIEMCVFFPIVTYLAIGLRPRIARWKFLALLAVAGSSLVGMIASSSRGALLGGGAGGLFIVARSRYKTRAVIAAAILGVGAYLAIPPEQKARLASSGTDTTSELRLTYWKNGIKIANRFPVLGIGYNNWMSYYSSHFAGRHQVPHNIFIQAAAELGYTGLIAFVLLIGGTFVINRHSRALAIRAGPEGRLTYFLACGLDGGLIGYLVSGFFVTVLYYPYFWINLAMTVALNTVAKQLPRPVHTPQPIEAGPRISARAAYAPPALGWASTTPALSARARRIDPT